MKFTLKHILSPQINELIQFDKIHLLDVMKKIGISNEKCSPPFTHAELTAAFQRKDFLFWLCLNNNLAGYMWREKCHDCLFVSGTANDYKRKRYF